MRVFSECPGVARFFRGVGAGLLLAWLACAQTDPGGHWEGTVKRDGGEIRISLDLAKDAQSRWIASTGVPGQMAGLVVTELAVEGKSVKFIAAEMMMTKFVLTLDGGVLKGTCATPQGSFPIEMKRTGEAKVDLIPASPAVSKELEGDWEGLLQMGDRTFRMIVHFKNQPDNTVKATIDAPDTQAFGLPLNDVKQTERKVEFGIRVAHAGFEGTLNPQGTEVAGQFLHDSGGVPLTLRKK